MQVYRSFLYQLRQLAIRCLIPALLLNEALAGPVIRIEAPNHFTCLDGNYITVLAYLAEDTELKAVANMSLADWAVEAPALIVDRQDTGHTSEIKIDVSKVAADFAVHFMLFDTSETVLIARHDLGERTDARVIVGFEDGITIQTARQLFEVYGTDIDELVTNELWHFGMLVGKIHKFNPCLPHELLSYSAVSFVVPDLQMDFPEAIDGEPFNFEEDNSTIDQKIAMVPEVIDWAVKKIKAHEVWTAAGGVTGKDIRVAVLDSGVERHRFLENRVKDGTSFLRGEDPYDDPIGHGTQMAGIIASKKTRDRRTMQDVFIGVAPEAIIVPVKITKERAGLVDGDSAISTLLAAVTWSASPMRGNCQVINIAMTLEDNVIRKNVTPPALARFEKVLEEAKRHATIVASAGNDNTFLRRWPASSNHVISVGASNEDDGRWVENAREGSNYGFTNTATGRADQWVKLSAPGKRVVTSDRNGGSTYVRGTSAASAMVSGTAALVIKKGRFTSATQVHDRLSATGVTLRISAPDDRDQLSIGKRIDAKEAVLRP